MNEGDVIVCGTGQAGTVLWNIGGTLSALLANGEVWTGDTKQCRIPQDAADLAACPLNVPRPETKAKKKSPYEAT